MPVQAEIRLDGTLGSAQALRGPDYRVEHTQGRLLGSNLFYSFADFSLHAGESVIFSNGPDSVRHLLGRVTGGEQSLIDGAIISEFPHADVYLINPAGIVFGEQARLDIHGAFHASGAESVLLGDGGRFSANAPENSVFTIAPPQSFRFGDKPGAVTVKGLLAVPDGQSASLSGSEIIFTGGGLRAPESGQILLAAPDSQQDLLLRFDMTENQNTDFTGMIKLSSMSGKANVDVSGAQAGRVFILAGRLFAEGGGIAAKAAGKTGMPGSVVINADEVKLTDGAFIDSRTEGGNDSAAIAVNAGTLEVTDLSRIDSSTLSGAGNGGDISIRADKSVALDGLGAVLSSAGNGGGDGGNIEIRTPELKVENGAFIQTGASARSSGAAGSIHIVTEKLLLKKAGQITSLSRGSGAAGDINVEAGELRMEGGQFWLSGEHGGGGKLQLTAKKFSMTQESLISTSALRAAGGEVAVAAEEVLIDNSNITVKSLSRDSGFNGGSLSVVASKRMEVRNHSLLTAEASAGDGGNISIRTKKFVQAHSTADAKTGGGRGGNITLRTDKITHLAEAMMIAQSKGEGTDNHGGNITLAHPRVAVLDNAELNAAALGGSGGNIRISTKNYFSRHSLFNVTSEKSIDGEIDINAPDTDLSGSLTMFPDKFLAATDLSVRTCAAQSGETGSSLAVAGKLSAEELDEVLIGTTSEETFLAPVFSKEGHGLLRQAKISRRMAGAENLSIRRALEKALRIAKTTGDKRLEVQILGQQALNREDQKAYGEALLLNRKALFLLQTLSAPGLLYQRQWQHGRLLNALGEPEAAIHSYRRAVRALQLVRRDLTRIYRNAGRSEIDEVLDPLFRSLADLLLRRAQSMNDGAEDKKKRLKEILLLMDRLKAAELQEYFKDECAKETIDIEDADPAHAAVIYPIFLQDRLEMLLRLPSGMRQLRISAGAAAVEKATRLLRDRLACKKSTLDEIRACVKSDTYREPAAQLYDWLLRPVLSLFSDDIKTVVFVPDGLLYTIPLSVLYDREKREFMLQKQYALTVMPGLTLTKPHPLPTKNRLLYAALTESADKNFPPMKMYAGAMETAVRKSFGQVVPLKGKEFVISGLESELSKKPYEVIHIFSHAKFSGSEKEDDTFIVTYRDRLSMDKLEKLIGRSGETPVELLALSACETAKGDRRAALGLSGLAFKTGVHSALGTLWAVREDAAYYLFAEFYRQFMQFGAGRAEALHKARLTLLNRAPFSHPHYWSPFVLIGSWL
ncbi:MAG: CHAT domain-containing protein [Gammaproteobacteria bacterium]|nr:CHAT domain-containing protein [Gammaproteobacteria bacterium]